MIKKLILVGTVCTGDAGTSFNSCEEKSFTCLEIINLVHSDMLTCIVIFRTDIGKSFGHVLASPSLSLSLSCFPLT